MPRPIGLAQGPSAAIEERLTSGVSRQLIDDCAVHPHLLVRRAACQIRDVNQPPSFRSDRAAGQGGVDDPGDQLVASGQQVAVGVDRGGDGLVTESGLDVRQRRAAGDQPGDVRVTQVVESERRDAFLRQRLDELAPHVGVEVAVVQRQPVRVVKTKSSAVLPLVRRASTSATAGEIVIVRRDFGVFGFPRW